MKISRGVVVALLTAGISLSLFAQASGPSRTLLLAMGVNAKRVMQYQWKQRITVVRRGKPAEPVIDQVSFGSSGQMQRTTISAPPKMGGIRGRIAAGVKEDVKDIMNLVAQYNKPQQMIGTVRNGRVSQPSGAGLITVQGKDVIQPGDAVTILANSATHLATHVDITTKFDGGPMTVAQDYGQLPDGPNVMKNMKVSVPGKNLVINVASYDYTLQTSRLHKKPNT